MGRSDTEPEAGGVGAQLWPLPGSLITWPQNERPFCSKLRKRLQEDSMCELLWKMSRWELYNKRVTFHGRIVLFFNLELCLKMWSQPLSSNTFHRQQPKIQIRENNVQYWPIKNVQVIINVVPTWKDNKGQETVTSLGKCSAEHIKGDI